MSSRDDLASEYLDLLPFEPYPVQEEALLAWFSHDEGVLVCAPTGTGKTLIAEAAVYEALRTGRTAYYTTPLIALTDQKFQEVQEAAVRWGFDANDVGLVTGNRKVNPDARVLVVVAEILLNRLLNDKDFDFSHVSAVVMDEFHSFNDRERGIVWELSLALLPKHVRLLLLSATVGNTNEFLIWLNKSHGRKLELVQGTDRRVPLRYHWVDDELLSDQLTHMADGDEETRRTPSLVFCFNREECWRVAEQLKGKALLADGQQKLLADELKRHDLSTGIGPKLKTVLLRGVGVHHAGVLPRYKRVVEQLFQKKLLSVCVCTETLAAGMNLPARSVLITALLKGPPGKKQLIDASSAHQMFGRAGRPQFDSEGYVYALSHEDDVKIARYRQKVDQIPEDTKDPQLIKKRKQLLKKMPTRRKTQQYWNESHFTRLIEAPPTNLQSQGEIPWRLLAWLLTVSPDISLVRETISRRLMDDSEKTVQQEGLVRMLLTLEQFGFVTLEPDPTPADRRLLRPHAADEEDLTPAPLDVFYEKLQSVAEQGTFETATKTVAETTSAINEADFGTGVVNEPTDESPESAELQSTDSSDSKSAHPEQVAEPNEATEPVAEVETPALETSEEPPEERPKRQRLSSSLKAALEAQGIVVSESGEAVMTGSPHTTSPDAKDAAAQHNYEPQRAFQTEQLADLLTFKSVNPLYGTFLTRVLPHANRAERIQALESVLQFPGSLVRDLRIPKADRLPPGAFTTEFLHYELLTRGLASPTELGDLPDDWDALPPEERTWPLTFPEKLLRLFQATAPGVGEVRIMPVWAVGELLDFGGDFNKLVTSRSIVRQEGIVFRHVLRFVLLCEEFAQHLREGSAWHDELAEISITLTEACRAVDERATDKAVESAREPDALTSDDT